MLKIGQEMQLFNGPKHGQVRQYTGKEMITFEGTLQVGSVSISCQHIYKISGEKFLFHGSWIPARSLNPLINRSIESKR